MEFSDPLAKVLATHSLDAANAGASSVSIVTPRRRLARQIKEEFSNAMQDKLAYNPQVITINDWVIKQSQTLLTKNQTLLMNSLQAQLIWNEALGQLRNEDVLDDLVTWGGGQQGSYEGAMKQNIVAQAQDAWRKIHLYRLELSRNVFTRDKIARFFYQWSAAYREICEERKLCDELMLADKLFVAIAAQEVEVLPSIWVGFDDTYPLYEQLYELIAKQEGNSTREISPISKISKISKSAAFKVVDESGNSLTPQATRTEYENDQDELHSLAQKVKRFNHDNPDKLVGVVIPGVENDWHQVRQLFARELLEERDLSGKSPEELLDERGLPFDMSWGEQLRDYPLIGAVLDLLQLSPRKISPALLLNRFNSPYLVGHKEEATARAGLNNKLYMMSESYKSISLADIVARGTLLTAKPGSAANLLLDTPQLKKCLQEFFAVEDAFAHSANPRAWAEIFGRQIRALGWGDIKWSKLEVQLWDKLLAMLDGLYEAGNVVDSMSRDEAIQFLSLQATQIFQPSPAPTKIKLLGIGEATGLMFDQLFVAKMDTTCIPQEQINFFIPFDLAKAANILGKDSHRAKEELIINGLKNAAALVNFSFARVVADEDRLPHSLLSDLPLQKHEEQGEKSAKDSQESPSQFPLEILHDSQAPPVADDETLSSLVGIIKSHSSCPFQSLIAHRVSPVKTKESQEEISPLARGIMLHKIFCDLWNKLESKKNLDSLLKPLRYDEVDGEIDKDATDSPSLKIGEELEGLITSFVTETLEDSRLVFLKDDMTFALEKQLLVALTKVLLLFEATRGQDFTVVEMEKKSKIVLDGREFNLKIDRIDHINDGEESAPDSSHVLIDYKLSNTKYTSSHLQNKRPKEPQLIIYSLLDDKLRSLGFITLTTKDKDQCEPSGLGLEDDGLFYNKKDMIDENTLEGMRANVKDIYASFIAGDSRVDPRDNVSCRECDFASICRIKESIATHIQANV